MSLPRIGGRFPERLLDTLFPWSKLRQGQRLLRLAARYTPERFDAGRARALGFDLVDVRRLERILVLARLHVQAVRSGATVGGRHLV